MKDIRCSCRKIICQIQENTIIIKCRHCKRLIAVHPTGLTTVDDGCGSEIGRLSDKAEDTPSAAITDKLVLPRI